MIDITSWIGLELSRAEERARSLCLQIETQDVTGRKQPVSDCRKVVAVREQSGTLRLLYARFLTEVPGREKHEE